MSTKMRRTRKSKSSAEKSAQINNVEPAEENETHKALLNDVVLQNIFKYLSYNDLKSCREMGNTTWLQNSKKAWWSRAKVVFKDNASSGNLQNKLMNYLKQTAITSSATNYMFQYFKGVRNEFWKNLGHSIKNLEFISWELSSVDVFRTLVYTRCPNLEKLVIRNFYFKRRVQLDNVESLKWQTPQFGEQPNLKCFQYRGCTTRFPVSWMEFLSHFPNLQVLKANVKNDDIFKTISIIRQHDPKMLKLNQIDVDGLPRDFNCDQSFRLVYLDPNLSLEKINIRFDNCQAKTLENILALHANSLEEFTVRVIHESICASKKISVREQLVKLEKLTIANCRFTADIFKYIPNVRKVELNYDGPSHNLLQEAEPKLIINTCKEFTLRIYRHSGNESTLDLKFFLNVFPNVETFNTINLNNTDFEMICERWTKLNSFCIFWGSQINEVGLLGYDPDSKVADEIRRPNIKNLKDLQSFSMESKYEYTDDKLTCIKIKNGSHILRELEGLQSLKLFELKRYEFKEKTIWKQIFAKYSLG